MPKKGDGFSEKPEDRTDKKADDKAVDSLKKKIKQIDKEISKDKRNDIKQEVTNKKKRRRRPRRRKNPQEQTRGLKSNPAKEVLDKKKEEKEDEFNPSAQDEVLEGEVVEDEDIPLNPFEAEEPDVSTIQKKALDDTPLDRKDQEIEEKFVEKKEEATPEQTGEALEQTAQEAEAQAEIGAAQEAQAADQAEVGEVVEAPVEPAPTPVEEPPAVNSPVEVIRTEIDREVKGSKNEIWGMLAESGITKKRVGTAVVILVLLVLFLMLKPWSMFGGDAEKADTDVVSDEPLESSFIAGEGDLGVQWGTIAGVESALFYGGVRSDRQNRIVYMIDHLRKMDNVYATDLYALMDRSANRRLILNKHVSEMQSLYDEGESIFNEINARITGFETEFENLVVNEERYEEEFFTSAESLLGLSAYSNLLAFIEASKGASEIKAYYKAYSTIGGFYITSLDLLEPRLEDIITNKEALIKGVRVFDIPSSDIKAVIPDQY